MFITKLSIPRRTFLRGIGATLALPLLDAMVPALTATAKTAANPVKRFGAVYMPNGVTMAAWTPKATGAAFELTPILQPMAPFRDRMLVVSGLNGAGGFGHTGASTDFLTGVKVETGAVAGPSIDQLIAAEFGKETQLASLEVALDPRDGTGSCDGQSCALSNTISWRTSTLLLPMENDPRVVFERLFGDSGTSDSSVRRERLSWDRSILDSVTSDRHGSPARAGYGRPPQDGRVPGIGSRRGASDPARGRAEHERAAVGVAARRHSADRSRNTPGSCSICRCWRFSAI